MGFTGRNSRERQQEARGAITPQGRRGRKVGWRHQDHVQFKGSSARLWVPKSPENMLAWPLQSGWLGATRGTRGSVRMQDRCRRLLLPAWQRASLTRHEQPVRWGSGVLAWPFPAQNSDSQTLIPGPPTESGEVITQLQGSEKWGNYFF